MVGARKVAHLYQTLQSQLFGKASERFAADDFRAGVGEETLAFVLEAMIDDVADDGLEDGIAKKFQTLIVQRLVAPFLRLILLRLVGESDAIQFDIVGIESQNIIKGQSKLLVGLYKELQLINKITHIIEIRIYA